MSWTGLWGEERLTPLPGLEEAGVFGCGGAFSLPAPARSRYASPVVMQRLSLHRFSPAVLGLGALVALGSVSCQNYRDQLQRGQGYYEQNQYESALAIWRNLERDQSALSRPEMVRYCYLRGMTDFRLGYREDARYWLGLAKAATTKGTPALEPDESKRLEETLNDLNQEVFGIAEEAPVEGAEALGDKCEWTSDCDSGFTCQESICVQADSSVEPASPGAPE